MCHGRTFTHCSDNLEVLSFVLFTLCIIEPYWKLYYSFLFIPLKRVHHALMFVQMLRSLQFKENISKYSGDAYSFQCGMQLLIWGEI